MNPTLHQRLFAFGAALILNWALVAGLHQLGAQIQAEGQAWQLAQVKPARG